MNFSPAFFHGEQALVAFFLSGLIVVIGVPLGFYVWFRHTKSSERTLALTYGVSTAVLCGLSLWPTENPISLFHLTVFTLAGILTLPWNLITLAATAMAGNSDIGDREIVVAMLLGAGVNTAILFYVAKRVRSLKA